MQQLTGLATMWEFIGWSRLIRNLIPSPFTGIQSGSPRISIRRLCGADRGAGEIPVKRLCLRRVNPHPLIPNL